MEPTTAFFSTETTTGQTLSPEASPSHASQATSDDDLSPTDAPSMFSTSMAPPKTRHFPDRLESIITPFVAAVSAKLEEGFPTTKLPDFDISDFGPEKAADEANIRGDVIRGELTTAVPTASLEPMEEIEDKIIIEVKTVLPDVLLSDSLSTKQMFAVGKTEESMLVGVTEESILESEATELLLVNTEESGHKTELSSLSESISKFPAQFMIHTASETSAGKGEAELHASTQSVFTLATEATFLRVPSLLRFLSMKMRLTLLLLWRTPHLCLHRDPPAQNLNLQRPLVELPSLLLQLHLLFLFKVHKLENIQELQEPPNQHKSCLKHSPAIQKAKLLNWLRSH